MKKATKTNWPQKDEIENMRWTNNHSQYHSFAFGFCNAQDCCENCDARIRVLCRAKRWIDDIKSNIIKRHYGVKTW